MLMKCVKVTKTGHTAVLTMIVKKPKKKLQERCAAEKNHGSGKGCSFVQINGQSSVQEVHKVFDMLAKHGKRNTCTCVRLTVLRMNEKRSSVRLVRSSIFCKFDDVYKQNRRQPVLPNAALPSEKYFRSKRAQKM